MVFLSIHRRFCFLTEEKRRRMTGGCLVSRCSCHRLHGDLLGAISQRVGMVRVGNEACCE